MDTISPRIDAGKRAFQTQERRTLEARSLLQQSDPRHVAPGLVEHGITEIWTSMLLADTPLDRSDVEALVRRQVALGGHRLEAYVRVADYAEAARYLDRRPLPSRRRGFVSAEEIKALHAHIARRTSDRAGSIRETSLRAFSSGMIATPAWQIPQALASFVDRFRSGPPKDTSTLAWIADAHARYERIHPFDYANGRVGRSLVNLFLKRCGFLSFVVRPRDAATYLAALRAADSRNPWPLATLLARSLGRSYATVLGSLPSDSAMLPLCELATGRERAALYKAAQRGALQTVKRDGRLLTTRGWIASYEKVV